MQLVLGDPDPPTFAGDGFGPVARTLVEVLPAIRGTVEFGSAPRPEYLARISEAFPVRDGRCTLRVFRAIRKSTNRSPSPVENVLGVAETHNVVELRGSRASLARGDVPTGHRRTATGRPTSSDDR